MQNKHNKKIAPFSMLRANSRYISQLCNMYREFRDVVFEDGGMNIIVDWPSATEGVGDFTPKADMGEGFGNSSLKPHILKHYIPEHPNAWYVYIYIYICVYIYIYIYIYTYHKQTHETTTPQPWRGRDNRPDVFSQLCNIVINLCMYTCICV